MYVFVRCVSGIGQKAPKNESKTPNRRRIFFGTTILALIRKKRSKTVLKEAILDPGPCVM